MKNLPVYSIVALSLLLPLGHVHAAKLEGQTFEDSLVLANHSLTLNGLGLRGVLFIKGYVAGLYLATRAHSYRDVVANQGPKRLQLRMLRGATSDDFIEAMVDGIRKNSTDTEYADLHERVLQMQQAIRAFGATKSGDIINFDYVPSVGTTMSLNGATSASAITGIDLYNAVLRIFVGERPVDTKLRAGLLGQ